MSKNEQVISQLESLLKELREGKEQSAASAVLAPGRFFKLPFKVSGVKMAIVALLFIIAVSGSVWLFSGSTFKKDSATFVEQVQELATLATAEAHVKVIMEQEDNKLFGEDIKMNIPGTKRELLLVVPATVMAGVDLKGITLDDIKVDDKSKELKIVLPPASLIQEPSIQMDKVRTFSDEGLFRVNVEWDEGFDLAAEAQEAIKKEAIEIGLLEKAETSAEKVLKEFFSNLGYSVEISYK